METYRTALVLGLGSSGLAAARLLVAEGTRVTAVDRAVDDEDVQSAAAALRALGADVRLGGERAPAEDFDLAVVSPGVPADSAWVRELEARHVPVISELELGARWCRWPMLAVTGSSGKSTLVKLCGDALACAGRRVVLAANYGPPLCDVVRAGGAPDWVVAEVSSFQLEKVAEFRPRVGVLLNVHPNHLDRHRDLPAYRAAKARLFARMQGDDLAVVFDRNADEMRRAVEQAGGDPGRARWVTFGLSADAHYQYDGGKVTFAGPQGRTSVSVEGTRFANEVLGITAAACVAAMEGCGVDPAVVARAARAFAPLPHRMCEIARINEVRFIDDSKATTLSALEAGVRMAGHTVRLIAGGLLKEHDLVFVKQTLETRVRKVYVIGQASDALKAAWGDTVPCSACGTLDRAVKEAWADAKPGDTILLSPGCASFDQFTGFEERGEKFAERVRSIHEE